MNRFFRYVIRQYRRLLQIHDTPHAIAGGIAIGVFFGFTPLFGIRILLAILLAWLFRCSKVAAALAANLHEMFFFFWGVVYVYEYKIGYWIIASPHRFPPKIPRHMHFNDFFHPVWLEKHWINWDVFLRIGWPWLIGSTLFGLPCAVASFFVALKLVRRYQEKRVPAVSA